ncbi:MAG TPA: helix-turn-helix transcriptional regulator [Acidimicrobiales bacterium]|nr:helix-turn-helix transcriptional regulator [Acidimicrobiales bacterium]
MVRARLTGEEIERGAALGEALRAARGSRSAVEVAGRAGLSIETVRKIEHGLVPTPTFFTVAAMATACGLSLDELLIRIRAAGTDATRLSA